MPIIKSWVATHTGLPSFYLSGPGVLMAGDRVIVRLDAGDERLVSDAGASAHPTTYTMGSNTVTLSRRRLEDYPRDMQGFLTDMSGRGFGAVAWDDNGDPTSWQSDVHVFSNGIVRWGAQTPARTGKARFALAAGQVAAFWRLVKERSPLFLGHFPGVMELVDRWIVVTNVSSERASYTGLHFFDVDYVEHVARHGSTDPLTPPAPVVTWGEWQSWGDESGNPAGWQNWSALEVAKRVAGMPA